MSTDKHLPDTVSARLDARLAPFRPLSGDGATDAAAESRPAMTTDGQPPRAERTADRRRLGVVDAFKLLYAALGAGGRVVPMGDNGQPARQFAAYAKQIHCQQQPC